MLSLLEVIKKTADFFAKKGVESARLNAELIIGHALGLQRMQLYLQFERLLPEPEVVKIRELVRRRGNREPLQHILGEAHFHDLKLRSDRRALIPRPETEQLLELAKDFTTAPVERFLDLGTGTGAIALTLAQWYPEAAGVAVDGSAEALALAAENAERNGLAERVEFRLSDWFSAIGPEERFDLIVSNPPYLTEEEWATAEPEVREWEPKQALVAGYAGCADLLAILQRAPSHLQPGGVLALETGIDQRERLLAAARETGYVEAHGHDDWTGRQRFVLCRYRA
jgi:release factor glutamine methyltransferase